MDFYKYEATGNDFIMFNGISSPPDLENDSVKDFCSRRTGIGADGVVVMLPSKKADLKMRIFNADGTEAEMCGNGIRALFLFAIDLGVLQGNKITVETGSGLRKIHLDREREGTKFMTVDMGEPLYKRSQIPMAGPPEEEALGVEIQVNGRTVVGSCISMGNPHCVLFVEQVSEYPVSTLGPLIENHRLFPEKTNVEFVHVTNSRHIEARVWERGVGETMACGTGACASLVAAKIAGLACDSAVVSLPGGELEVSWKEGNVYLTGAARYVFKGTINIGIGTG